MGNGDFYQEWTARARNQDVCNDISDSALNLGTVDLNDALRQHEVQASYFLSVG